MKQFEKHFQVLQIVSWKSSECASLHQGKIEQGEIESWTFLTSTFIDYCHLWLSLTTFLNIDFHWLLSSLTFIDYCHLRLSLTNFLDIDYHWLLSYFQPPSMMLQPIILMNLFITTTKSRVTLFCQSCPLSPFELISPSPPWVIDHHINCVSDAGADHPLCDQCVFSNLPR